MYYLIDGYNLLFQIAEGSSLQEEREDFIKSFVGTLRKYSISATIVFDAAFQQGDCSRSHILDTEIVFTDQHQTADEYIIELLSTSYRSKPVKVVTSDNLLSWLARQKGAQTISGENFLKSLASIRPSPEHPKSPRPSLYQNSSPSKKPSPKASPSSTSSEEFSSFPGKAPFGNFEAYLKIFEERYQALISEDWDITGYN
ncbi:MAG: NYN domain-containing protein [Chlamydiota bacterium]